MRLKLLGDGPLASGARNLAFERHDNVIHPGEDVEYDLLVLAGYDKMLPTSTWARARLGALCFHPSMLPRHRGRDAVKWTLEFGEVETGATWFWPDAGMDTGPIAAQQSAPILRGVSAGRLYYGTLVPLGLVLLNGLLTRLDNGERPSTPQDEAQATYEPPFRSDGSDGRTAHAHLQNV